MLQSQLLKNNFLLAWVAWKIGNVSEAFYPADWPCEGYFLKDELAKSPVLADMADGVNLANAVGVCHMRQQLIGEAKARMTFSNMRVHSRLWKYSYYS